MYGVGTLEGGLLQSRYAESLKQKILSLNSYVRERGGGGNLSILYNPLTYSHDNTNTHNKYQDMTMKEKSRFLE